MSVSSFMTEMLSWKHFGARNLLKEKTCMSRNFINLPFYLKQVLGIWMEIICEWVGNLVLYYIAMAKNTEVQNEQNYPFIHLMGDNIANWQVMVSKTWASLRVQSRFSNLWYGLDIAEFSLNDSWAWITVAWL